ncbi:pilus assembly protein [Vandammella animalimorsus]|uniref:Pilus assembly protein n=1 Tax=Vandammella animalimorsus TaxID=2029117 RepID=A0A2A2AVJ9_9BURK|nr:pilus assembly protein [Vandammella animalimorsus]PAT41702.1 pilus assembly protein [Vandammella animalimorsus]
MQARLDLIKQKAKAFGWHVLASAALALAALGLVLGLWYPHPYRDLSGGVELLGLIIGIDIIAGPLLTLLVYHPQKTRRALLVDFSVIGLLQLLALAYGLSVAVAARPVHLVFEKDLFRVVHASDVYHTVGAAPRLPLSGPTLLATQMPHEAAASNQILKDALERGIFEAYRPELWRPYAQAHAQVLQAARPAALLLSANPALRQQTQNILQSKRLRQEDLLYLPVVGRDFVVWTVLIGKHDAKPRAYLPFDPFNHQVAPH